ncbi:TPA: AAA family ATPase, partial [Streptococcus equi subsp. zooepidemicus]|nr:AAA family ATPase [Streptococcus equi subsp. zooepidemicus]
MKISNIIIKKFRSIKEASFDMKDITAIVGENNAGKTGILRALNSVFNFEEEKE